MKLSELEDADQLVTKEDLDLRLQSLERGLSDAFHKEILSATRWGIGIMSGIVFAYCSIILGGVYFMLAHYRP